MKKMLSFILTAAVILSISACGKDGNNGKSVPVESISVDIITRGMDLAFDLFRRISSADPGNNVLISPYSISAALTMAYLGAGGTTKDEMAKVLGYTEIDGDTVAAGHKSLIYYLQHADKNVSLLVSNSIWINEGSKIRGNYIDLIADTFDARTGTLDFSDPKAADTINAWIKKDTDGMIGEMLNGPIEEGICMYLVDAVYFKGDWTVSFNSSKTYRRGFNNSDGTKTEVEMMYLRRSMYYSRSDGHSAVRIPYGSGNIAMYCILPDEGVDIGDFVKKLDPEIWEDITLGMALEDEVILRIPRFRIEYGVRIINEELREMGMIGAFNEDTADFSGITADPRGIYISRILHKAAIEVNEKGTEAAASTVIEMTYGSVDRTPVPEFTVDRPFVFIIADISSGTVLFMGKVENLEQ